jgi:ATP-dependent DNA helicase RecG
MVPTEILAQQHFTTLTHLCELIPQAQRPHICLLTNNSKPSDNEFNEADIIVGTHALITSKKTFSHVGLVVVDEQHKFGVVQRGALKKRGLLPHMLSLTATPIPRTVLLTLYGELDISVIDEFPKGRKEIKTYVTPEDKRQKAYEWMKKELNNHHQVFIVCPFIEQSESETLQSVKAASEEIKKIKTEFKNYSAALLHGKLKADEKEAIMGDFKKGQIDILVATSVIEVGVNIPNASVMMIEGAERFGLAQLHQFRGRVGRSDHQSYCFLFTDSDATTAKERLTFFEAHHDGFKLAEKDLEIRGPGEVYGTMQSGMAELRLAKLTDRELIKKAKTAAVNIAPLIKKYPTLLKKVKEWESRVHLE